MPESSERTALYRLYDVEKRLLYIGITNNPTTRWQQHARTKGESWWSDVATKELEWFDSRRDAEKAEVIAIRTEGPPYNDRHAGSWDEPGCRRPAPIPSERARRLRSEGLEKSARFNRECSRAKISFPDMVARRLRERIASGVYQVGTKLPTGLELCGDFGISSLTLTRAKSQLISEGLLEVRHGRGTFVVATP